jgi:hypothetical protein
MADGGGFSLLHRFRGGERMRWCQFDGGEDLETLWSLVFHWREVTGGLRSGGGTGIRWWWLVSYSTKKTMKTVSCSFTLSGITSAEHKGAKVDTVYWAGRRPRPRKGDGSIGGYWAKLAGLAGAMADFGYYTFVKGMWKVEGC